MTEQEIERAAKAYRQYREDCGYKDPVALDEIESAYYMGMIKMKEMMMQDAVNSEAVCTKEGVVTESGNFIKFTDGTWIDLDPTLGLCHAFSLNDGEKVKVIIIKEERI